MKGGLNKIMRNITATQAKTDFEKVRPTPFHISPFFFFAFIQPISQYSV